LQVIGLALVADADAWGAVLTAAAGAGDAAAVGRLLTCMQQEQRSLVKDAQYGEAVVRGVRDALTAACRTGGNGGRLLVRQLLAWRPANLVTLTPGSAVVASVAALRAAVAARREDIARLLVRAMPPTTHSAEIAASAGYLELVQLLLERAAAAGVAGVVAGAPLGPKNIRGLWMQLACSAMEAAAIGGQVEVLMWLLRRLQHEYADDGETDTATGDGGGAMHRVACSAFYFGASVGHARVVALLAAALPQVVAAAGKAALLAAARRGRLAVVELLLHQMGVAPYDEAPPPPSSASSLQQRKRMRTATTDDDADDDDSEEEDECVEDWETARKVEAWELPRFGSQLPLYAAAAGGHARVVRALLAVPPPAAKLTKVAVKALVAAADAGHADAVRALLLDPADQTLQPAGPSSGAGSDLAHWARHALSAAPWSGVRRALDTAVNCSHFEVVCALLDFANGCAGCVERCVQHQLVYDAMVAGQLIMFPNNRIGHCVPHCADIPMVLLGAAGGLSPPSAAQLQSLVEEWWPFDHGTEMLRALLSSADVSGLDGLWGSVKNTLRKHNVRSLAKGGVQRFLARRGVHAHDA
jgi:hypothetical protein